MVFCRHSRQRRTRETGDKILNCSQTGLVPFVHDLSQFRDNFFKTVHSAHPADPRNTISGVLTRPRRIVILVDTHQEWLGFVGQTVE